MRNILFILLLCNVMLLKAQSLELEHWRIINSSEIADADAKVSQPSYPTTGWYQATVPTTVLNALVKENVYPDPRIGLNNYLIPDVSDEFNALSEEWKKPLAGPLLVSYGNHSAQIL